MDIPEMFYPASNRFRIVIDREASADGNIRGRILFGGVSRDFSSLSRMVLLMDSLLEATIAEEERPGETEAEKTDFDIEVLFRQNYSWQGKVSFPGLKKEAVFRSVLELLALIEAVAAV